MLDNCHYIYNIVEAGVAHLAIVASFLRNHVALLTTFSEHVHANVVKGQSQLRAAGGGRHSSVIAVWLVLFEQMGQIAQLHRDTARETTSQLVEPLVLVQEIATGDEQIPGGNGSGFPLSTRDGRHCVPGQRGNLEDACERGR